MKFQGLNKKSYIIAITVVMIVNSFLVIFLLRETIAQTSEQEFKNQPVLDVDVLKQYENPLQFTFVDVDTSDIGYQSVNYTIQNISNKAIRGYVISAKTKDTGIIITKLLSTKPFQSYNIQSQQLRLDRRNIKTDNKLLVSIDYVEFNDGSSWGENSLFQAEHILGGIAGSKAAVEQIKKLIVNGNLSTLNSLSVTKLVDVDVEIPEIFQNKSDKWQKAYRGGYRSIIGLLKHQYEKGNDFLLEKLIEVEQNFDVDRREK